MLNISKRQTKFLGHIRKKKCLENLLLMDRVEVKRDQRKQCVPYLADLS